MVANSTDYALWVMNADGSGRLALATGYDPAWSPDGTLIAFSSPGLSYVYVQNADGSGRRPLVEGRNPLWSPDGQSLAFTNGGPDLNVITVDGTGARVLSSRQSEWYDTYSHPSWRPDGQALAYPCRTVYGLVSTQDICIVTADGRDDRNLTQSGQPGMTLALLAPALVHLVLLFGLMSPWLYVCRHTQQALLIAFLRTSAPLFLFLALQTDAWPWAFVNGSIWLFGSIWGLRQVAAGECWLMRLHGEGDQLPRPWAIARPETPVEVTPETSSAAPAPPPGDAQAALDEGLASLAQGRQPEAIACFTRAFQQGDASMRRLALTELDKLGQVQRG